MTEQDAITAITEYVERRSAELAARDSAELFVQLAYDSHSQSRIPSRLYVPMLGEYTLHLLHGDAQDEAGTVGPVQSKRLGKSSVSYTNFSMSRGSNASTPEEEDLNTSSYGRLYLRMVKLVPARGLARGSN